MIINKGLLAMLGTPLNILNKQTPQNDPPADIRTATDEEFLEQCKPKLERLEKIRKIKKLVYEFRKKIAFPIVLIGTPLCGYLDYILLMWQRGSDNSGAGLTFLFLGAIYWWVTQPKRQYAKAYKLKILPDLAKLFGNFTYEIDGKIDMDAMEPSKIVPGYDSYGSEDYFRGTYKGVDIEFLEMHLTETRGSGKHRRTVTTFKGVTILMEMQRKKFYGHTILDHDKGKMGEWIKEKSLGLKRARMADPEFEKIYDAYTNDQVEARYLIDPLIIEQYKKLYTYFAEAETRDKRPRDNSWIEKLKSAKNYKAPLNNKQSMTVAYYDNKILIMIGSNFNHFEPADLHISATNPVSILHMKREIGDILSIIDRLDAFDPRAVHEESQKTAALNSESETAPDANP